jgi:hypothetical protein
VPQAQVDQIRLSILGAAAANGTNTSPSSAEATNRNQQTAAHEMDPTPLQAGSPQLAGASPASASQTSLLGLATQATSSIANQVMGLPGVASAVSLWTSLVGAVTTALNADPNTAAHQNQGGLQLFFVGPRPDQLGQSSSRTSLAFTWPRENFLLKAIDELNASKKLQAALNRASKQLGEAAMEAELDENKKKKERDERERHDKEVAIEKIKAIDQLDNIPNGETQYIAAKLGSPFFSIEEAIRMAQDAEQREQQEKTEQTKS